MRFLDWIFSRAPTPKDELPTDLATLPPGLRAPVPEPPDIDSSETIPADAPEDFEPLENLFCHLEYEDSAGNFTSRPVTFLQLDRRHAIPSIYAICHLRKAPRSFRVDRIRAIITADGEVFEEQAFLTDVMALDIRPHDGFKPRPRPRPRQLRSRDLRDILMAPLTVLVACGKSDGRYHPEEVDRIMIWAENEAMHLHDAGLIDNDLTIEDADALGTTIAGMRPQIRTLRRHMEAALLMDPAALARFRHALQQVIEADGILHDAEARFMADFDLLATLAATDSATLSRTIAAAAVGKQADALPVNLQGAVFVFTGRLSRMTRNEARQAVEARNGVVKGHVDFAHPFYTAYLVAGEGGGSKLIKARASGMPIISEAEFRHMLGLK